MPNQGFLALVRSSFTQGLCQAMWMALERVRVSKNVHWFN